MSLIFDLALIKTKDFGENIAQDQTKKKHISKAPHLGEETSSKNRSTIDLLNPKVA